MTAIMKVLDDVCKSGESVCVYSGKATEFSFGKVLAYNEDFYALYAIAPNGSFDGVLVRLTDSISRIDRGGQYIEKMSKLTTAEDYAEFPHTLDDENIREQVIRIAAQEHSVVSIELMESGTLEMTGFISTVDADGSVKLLLVDEYGYDDGSSVTDIENITEISCLSGEEQIIQRLWEKNSQD